MKKLITAFALVTVMLAGCSGNGQTKPEEPTTETVTLDAPSFTTELGNTADEKVRVYLSNPERISSALADESVAALVANYEGLKDVKSQVQTVLAGLTLTEDADQNKVYGDPVFFVDLNKVMDANYQRFVVYENMIVIAAGDTFKNYTLDDASKEAITTLYNDILTVLTAE